MVSDYLSWRALSGFWVQPHVEIFVRQAAFNKNLGVAVIVLMVLLGLFFAERRNIYWLTTHEFWLCSLSFLMPSSVLYVWLSRWSTLNNLQN